MVPAAELHAVDLVEKAETDGDSTPLPDTGETAVSTPQQHQTSKSNVNTHDDPTNQKLTMTEIEDLKKNTSGSGRELIEKIMQSHSALEQKTAFSLAKYTLRKQKKYMKRFTALPLDVLTLVDHLFADREHGRIMEMRNEAVGLVGCWANAHAAGQDEDVLAEAGPASRYLIVDDTGGILVAAVAERMGILHKTNFDAETTLCGGEDADEIDTHPSHDHAGQQHGKRPSRLAMSACSSSINLVHANQQPNLGLLRHFNYDSNNPTTTHPLYAHLKTLSWLQLLDPSSDITYQEPAVVPDSELQKMKSNRRSTYYRKRRRWERAKAVIDETRAGEFDGLVIASFTNPTSILRHLVPLLAGGSQVVVYSPTVEPLVELADYYSTARRTAFINTSVEHRTIPSKDFPLDPTLLLAPTVQTARVRRWQVLPGRTHPLMTGRGGADGFILVGTRVIPAAGKVEARGRPPRGKKARMEDADDLRAQIGSDQELDYDSDSEIVQLPLKKQKVEESNEYEAQRAVDREFLERMGQESTKVSSDEKPAVLVQQESDEDELPVLGPATEALKQQQRTAELNVKPSIES